MKKIFLFLLISSFSFAQNANRKFENYKLVKNTLEIKTSDGTYFIKPYSDKIVETTFVPAGEKNNPNSHGVVLAPENVTFKVKQSENTLVCSTTGITVSIQKAPFQISYLYKNNLLISEKKGYVQRQTNTKELPKETLEFNLDATEALYGAGARVLGMNRRGNRLELYNQADYGYGTHSKKMNFSIPLVMSSKIYAVHFDNGAIGWLDLDSKKDNTLAYETISGRKTYQVVAGDTWTDLTSNYTALTGRQPLIPRWALGNFSSRFGYHTQEEVTKTIDKYLKDEIPVDAIILDLYWFGKTVTGTMGNLDWDKDNFPNPTKMISDLNNKGVKTILITEPFILTTSSKWNDAVDKKVLATDNQGNPFKYDFFFGNTGLVDVFKPEGKKWFWDIYKNLINQGVGGWWGDLGEPEVFPSAAMTAQGTADEVHNIYGHNWAKLLKEGYKNDFPNVRPFILMRAGYSGSQHYGMIPWSGDVGRSWEGLQAQPEIALQMGMQGMGYMHSDLGGFAGDYFDNELYVRWLQYGVFQPIYRPHAQEEVASEPVNKDILTKAKVKKQIELRYQLLPYNYTLAFENNNKGLPLMRPLFFEEPTNEKLLKSCDSYLWGNDFLVTPITKAGVTNTTIYFPKTNNWYDFYTGAKHEAGATENIAVSADNIPVFVRGGAFIPMIKTIQNTTKYSLSDFDLHFYYDEKATSSSGKLYNDDGITPNDFEKGAYEILNFSNSSKDKVITLKMNTTVGKSFVSTDKNVKVLVHNIPNKPAKITVNGVTVDGQLNGNILELPVVLKKDLTNEIKIQL
ncbi:TIM-barrel domain-containing protein [Flavobacterium sp.]|uniref:glycoside hydrolase family 31 protein n=1 Tax=Flavobacterium sp. TaxID=239 RepID=UPI002B60428A|nr:TIM-barrel domain-containing protein [Flavobacterium sp.]HSD08607.1 TIM-barrel domain-containing protein [Flavobacterium sp.]